jgi:hypothetical protein
MRGQVRPGWVMIVQVMLGYNRLGHISQLYSRLGQVSPG